MFAEGRAPPTKELEPELDLYWSPMAIVVNKPIPELEANATGGIKVTNTSHLGQVLALYFYPKDNTPGCTTEAMQFRDKYKDFVKAGATVFGVSRDNMKSHEDFKSKLE